MGPVAEHQIGASVDDRMRESRDIAPVLAEKLLVRSRHVLSC